MSLPTKPNQTTDWRAVFAREAIHTANPDFRARLREASGRQSPTFAAYCWSFVRRAAAGVLVACLVGPIASVGALLREPPPTGLAAVTAGFAALGVVAAAFALLSVLFSLGDSRRRVPSWNALSAFAHPTAPPRWVRPLIAAGAIAPAVDPWLIAPVWSGPRGPTEGALGLSILYFIVGGLGWGIAVPDAPRDLTGQRLPLPIPPEPRDRSDALSVSWWTRRPSVGDLLDAMGRPDAPLWARSAVEKSYYEKRPLNSTIYDLGGLSWRNAVRAAVRLRRLGTEVLPALLDNARRSPTPDAWALRVARQIGEDSIREHARFASVHICPECLVRYAMRRTPGRGGVRYCACRSCGRDREPIVFGGKIVAVLDARGYQAVERTSDAIRVNWLTRARTEGFEGSAVFDFESVDIVRATDGDVRHFLVDVTSDTDPVRKKRYPRMRCEVAAGCALSEATMRQLRGVFGEVVVG